MARRYLSFNGTRITPYSCETYHVLVEWIVADAFYGFYLWFLLGRNRQESNGMVETTGKVEKEIAEDIETKERSMLSAIMSD